MKPLLVLVGIFGGALMAYGSVIITTSQFNRALKKESKEEYDRHNRSIRKMKNVLTGTNSEAFIPCYIQTLNVTRSTFKNDYEIILTQFEKILQDDQPVEVIEKNMECFICSLDILRDFYSGKQFALSNN